MRQFVWLFVLRTGLKSCEDLERLFDVAKRIIYLGLEIIEHFENPSAVVLNCSIYIVLALSIAGFAPRSESAGPRGLPNSQLLDIRDL